MQILVWIGTAMTLVGVGGLLYCVVLVQRAKTETDGDEAALKSRLQKVVAFNLGALAVSALGLMCVVFGLVMT